MLRLNIAHKVRIHNITTHRVLISSTLVCILYKESVTSVNILHNRQFSHALDFESCLSDFKRWGLLMHSLGSSFTGLVVSMVITFSFDMGGGQMLVVGLSLGVEEEDCHRMWM